MRIAVVVAVTVSVVVSFHDVTVWYLVTNMMPEEGVTGITVNRPESLSGLLMDVVEPLGSASTACVICGSAVVW